MRVKRSQVQYRSAATACGTKIPCVVNPERTKIRIRYQNVQSQLRRDIKQWSDIGSKRCMLQVVALHGQRRLVCRSQARERVPRLSDDTEQVLEGAGLGASDIYKLHDSCVHADLRVAARSIVSDHLLTGSVCIDVW
jgi:hypothetical protein